MKCPTKLQLTIGLCAGVALEFLPPVTATRLFTKDKYLEPMFGDVGQARTNAAMLLPMIATTSSRTCTKPTVVRRISIVFYPIYPIVYHLIPIVNFKICLSVCF